MRRRSFNPAGRRLALWTLLALYTVARVLQLWAGTKVPILTVVILHVLPAASFAVIHSHAVYRAKGTLVFLGLCLATGSLFESLSLRTGFPFGHYVFTTVMGPKLLGLPVLLALAYLGLGYVSWTLAILILGDRGQVLAGSRIVAVPLIASFIMVAWDLAMDPVWATLDRAWVWRDGGAYFGVPVSNFLGWYLTVFIFYLLFALYLRRQPAPDPVQSATFWRLPVLFYAVCAAGNLLLAIPKLPGSFVDGSGRAWLASEVMGACVLVSIFVMVPFAVLAWIRLHEAKLTPAREAESG